MIDMDYGQKYKEALTWVESIYHELSHDRQMEAEAFFPELKESEDEKIRKEFCKDIWTFIPNEKAHKYIAWLEKQGTPNQVSIWKHWKDGIAGNGEGKPIYLVKIGNTYSLNSCLGFECDYIELSELDNLMLEKQGSAWSEEDEVELNGLIKHYEDGHVSTPQNRKTIKWLKSLKQRIGG